MTDLCEKANIYEKYGIDKYMSALGLSVQPLYRGAALGAHLLNARYKSSIILFDDILPFPISFDLLLIPPL